MVFSILCGTNHTDVANAVRKIKLQGDAYWWDASSIPLKEAKKNPDSIAKARSLLSSSIAIQIKSYVQGQLMHSESETEGALQTETNQKVLISSNMYLENVKFLEYQEKKQYHIFAYLLRSDFQAQEEKMVTRLQNIIAGALGLEDNDPNGAIYQYYKAFLMSHNLTNPVHCSILGGDMQLGLEKKLRDFLQSVPLSIRLKPESNSMGAELQLDSSILASGLQVSIPTLNFYGLSVTDGKCKFFYDTLPSRNVEELKIVLGINPALAENEAELRDIAKNSIISVTRLCSIDFTEYIQVDFSYRSDGESFTFQPEVKGISVKSIDWDFGDGSAVSSFDPILHSFQQPGVYAVKMTVNTDCSKVKRVEVNTPALQKPVQPVVPETMIEPILSLAPKEENLSSETSELLAIKNSRELQAYLQRKKQEKVLTWGRIGKNTPLIDMWVVIWDSTGLIVAVLSPQDEYHYDLLNKRNVKDIKGSFPDKEAVYISYF